MAVDWDKLVLAPTTAIFGDKGLFLPKVGAPFDVYGVFDKACRIIKEVDGLEVTTVKPVYGVRRFFFEGHGLPRQGDEVVIFVVRERYALADIQPDGHGELKLILNYVGAA